MNNKLQSISKLIKKTGDKVIVINENFEPQFVMMSTGDYEKIIENEAKVRDLTEEELLSKINRDIAIWKSEQHEADIDNITEQITEEFNSNAAGQFTEKKEEQDRYYFEPIEENDAF